MAFLFSKPARAVDPPGLVLTAAEAARQRAQRVARVRLAREACSAFFVGGAGAGR